MKQISRLLVASIIAFIVSGSVYVVNRGFGNAFLICFQISALIFFNVLFGFLIYYVIRDVYATRWTSITLNETKSVHITKFMFEIKDPIDQNTQPIDLYINLSNSRLKQAKQDISGLYCELIRPLQSIDTIQTPQYHNNKQLIVFVHGFNSSLKDIRHLGIALAVKGYTCLLYDARGSGNTKFGNKFDIMHRSTDLMQILVSIKNSIQFREYQISFVAESIGGINLCYVFFHASLQHELVDFYKMILISVPPVYNRIFPKHILPFTRKWFIRLNYILKRLHPYMKNEQNDLFSPQLLLQNLPNHLSDPKDPISSKRICTDTVKRILFIYSKTDMLISCKQINGLQAALTIPETNLLLFNSGGHNQLKNELGILSAIVHFLKK